MKKYIQWMLVCCVLFFFGIAACDREGHQPIPKDVGFAATLNLIDGTIDFSNEQGQPLARWTLAKTYTGAELLPDGDTLVLFGAELEEADLYSLAKGKKTGSIKTGKGIVNVHYLEARSEWVMADKKRNEVRFFNRDGEETASIQVDHYPLDMHASESILYVVAYQGTSLEMIDVKDKKIVGSIPIPPSSAGLLVREEAGEIWIGGHGIGTKPRSTVSIYSLENRKLKEEVATPLMPVAFLENDLGFFVLSHGTNHLYHFDREKQLVNEREVGANPFAIASLGGQLVVAGYDSNELYWINPKTLEIVQQVKVGKGPFEIFTREQVK